MIISLTHTLLAAAQNGFQFIISTAELTLCTQVDYSFWFDTINLGWSIVYREEPQVTISR